MRIRVDVSLYESQRRRDGHSRIDHLHTTLEPTVEVALSPATRQHLRLDHELIGTCAACSFSAYSIRDLQNVWSKHLGKGNPPKSFATFSASSAENAGRALGVGIPYCTEPRYQLLVKHR